MSGHAFLPPSGADGWGNCSYWPWANQQFPKPDTRDTLEGEAAHWVCSECLTNWKSTAIEADLSCADFVGRQAPNSVTITDAMADAAQMFVDDCLAIAHANGGAGMMHIEESVAMPRIHPEHNWGTPDFWLFNPATGVLYVSDFKYGFLEVDPRECLQLCDYAEGVIEQLGLNDQYVRVDLRIVQPRCYSAYSPVRSWAVLASDLRPLWNQLHMKAAEAVLAPKQSAGGWCKHCPGLGKCGASRRYVYGLRHYLDLPIELDEMSPEDLGVEYDILKETAAVVKERLAAIEQQVAHAVDTGTTGTGYTREVSPGRLNWRDEVPPAQVVALGQMFNVDLAKPACLTPTQARAAVAAEAKRAENPGLKDAFELTIKTMSARAAGALKLVKLSDGIVARTFKKG